MSKCRPTFRHLTQFLFYPMQTWNLNEESIRDGYYETEGRWIDLAGEDGYSYIWLLGKLPDWHIARRLEIHFASKADFRDVRTTRDV